MSVYKSPNSPYYLYDFKTGKRRFHGSTKVKSRKEAEVVERELKVKAKAEMELEERTLNGPLTLDFAAERYWTEYGQHRRDHKGTWHALELLIKFFGKDKRLDEITDADVSALVTWRRNQTVKGLGKKTVSNATVNRSAVEPLRKLFIRARTIWRYQFPREPVWKHHRLKEPPERVRELHANEDAALTGALRPDFEPWFRFASATGLRLAETLITWDKVNWQAKTITTTGKGGRLVSTPITPDVAAILEPLKGHHPEAVFTFVAKRTRKDQVKGKRYEQVKGERRPITYAGAKSEWQAMRKRSGIKGFRFHDVRHDMATKLLRQTNNIKLVSKALNHADIKTTSRYAHVLDGEVSDALQRLSKSRNKSRTKAMKNAQTIETKA